MNEKQQDRTAAPLQSLGAGVFQELLRTPAFKQLLKNHLTCPDTPERVTKELLWADVDLSLALAGKAVGLANDLVRTVGELARQIQNLPEPLLQDLVGQLKAGFDTQALGQTSRSLVSLFQQLSAREPQLQQDLLDGAASALRSALRLARTIIAHDPALARDFLDLGMQLFRSAIKSQFSNRRG